MVSLFFRRSLQWSSLLLCFASFSPVTTATRIRSLLNFLTLPPIFRLKLGQLKELRRDCENFSRGACIWEADIKEGYELANCIFTAIAKGSKDQTKSQIIWLPNVDSLHILEGLINVISENSVILGGVQAKLSSWPQVPTTQLELVWNDQIQENEPNSSAEQIQNAVSETEGWVVNTLCRLKLCPHTSSLQRGAVGLELANVKEGPVIVRHAQSISMLSSTCRAATTAAAFWENVSMMAKTDESDVSTILFVAPASYDNNFLAFASLCDTLIEPSVKATGADSIVGRAWFHPNYDAALIGHERILPGHALPASFVSGFIDKLGVDSQTKLTYSDIALANNAVRWTPHATINLLRRSQLHAAKQLEAQLANKKPNAVYVKNVIRIIADGVLLRSKK